MFILDDYNNLIAGVPAPDVKKDLVEAQHVGHFDGLPAERLMVLIELLRNNEITLQKATAFAGLAPNEMKHLLNILHIEPTQ